MKKLVSLILALVMVLSLVACGNPGTTTPPATDPNGNPSTPTEVYTLRCGLSTADNSPMAQCMKLIADYAYEKTNGGLEIEFYYSGLLGNSEELLDQVGLGSLDICVTGTSTITKTLPGPLDAFSLFFFVQSYDHLRAIAENHADEMMAGIQDHWGVPCGLWSLMWYQICNNAHPVETMADMDGLKLRYMGTDISYQTLEAWGIAPVSMGMGDVPTSIQQKTIDGLIHNLDCYVSEKYYEYVDYFTICNLMCSVNIPIVSNAVKDKIPAEYYDILMEGFEEYKYWTYDAGLELEESFVQDLIDSGANVVIMSDEARAELSAIAAPYNESYRDRIGAELYDSIVKLGTN